MIILRNPKLKLRMAKELGVDELKRASFQSLQRHRHIQLTFMLKGALSWNSVGGRIIRLHGGEYCITCHGNKVEALHNVLSQCSLMWTIFDPFSKGAEEGSCFSKDELSMMGQKLVDSSMSVRPMNSAISFFINEMRHIVAETRGGKISFPDLQKIRIGLMGVFIESANQSVDSASLADAFCGKVRELVLLQPAKNLSVDDIAASFGLSPGFFGKKFRAESGMPVADFVRRVKLEEALRLMRGGSKNITDISFSLGFSSSQYFATLFGKYYGCSPSQFIKKHGR